MPERDVKARAQRDKREGKAASTQAGEFVREEIEHVREGKHGARSTKQAIAIGLSKARRAGVDLPAPKRGKTSEATRKNAERALEAGRHPKAPSRTRSRATTSALKREGQAAASTTALSRQAHASSSRRSPAERSAAAKRSARSKGPARRKAAAKSAPRTRAHTQ